jgi:methionyl-tRNA formyltransferase
MRVLFMGTPEFASCSLRRLYEDGHEICAVFTRQDKPASRGMKMTSPPVKLLAMERGTPVFQPATLRDGALEIIRSLNPDIIVVVAYGRILPREILSFPRYGCVNVHGSLLPKYRGAAPVQWAVLNGEKTTMYMDEELDSGDIIDTLETPIGEDETAGELFNRLMELGAELLSKTLRDIEAGTATRRRQDASEATYAPMITKELSPVDWSKSPQEIKNRVRGLLPWPAATAEIFGRKCKIFKVAPTGESTDKPDGSIVSADKNGLKIACGGGSVIEILELQAEGKRRMAAADFLRGCRETQG